jgi:hypothetical protein
VSPTLEELELGAKAFERVRMHDLTATRFTNRDRWLTLFFVVFLLVWGWAEHIHFRQRHLVFLWFVPAGLLWSWVVHRFNRQSYANHQLILRLLEEKYGEALPWVAEAKQLAQARELEEDIALAQQQARPA